MAKHVEQFNVRLDGQAKADARTIARRFGLNGTAAAIRYALRNLARGLKERKAGMARIEIPAMTAKELLEELLQLQQERPADFDKIEVYVEVVDRESYETEQRAADDNGVTELEFTVIGEGSAYAFQVHTPVDRDGKQGDDYILIAAVELDD